MKKIPHIDCSVLLRYAVASILLVTATFAEAVPNPSSSNTWENASIDELTDAISQTAAQLNEHARKAAETRKIIEYAWSNPTFTSETIETKRQALKKAEAAFIQARIALQEEMNLLPEIQKLSEEQALLLNKIEVLKTSNMELINLLRARRKTVPAKD